MRPAHVLVPAAFTALVAACLVVRRTDATMLAYDIPIAWPFAAFGIELARTRPVGRVLALDLVVVAVALARMVPGVPAYSGHALFLGYAAVRCASPFVRVPAIVVLIEVLVIKLGIWRDWVTPIGSAVLVALALVCLRWLRPVPSPADARRHGAPAGTPPAEAVSERG